MQRLTVSLDEEIARLFDSVVTEQGYRSRSEAVRDLVRQSVEARRQEGAAGAQCVANLSYIYHRTPTLAQRLLDMQQAHHDLVVSTMHVTLDHESSLETMVLKGPTPAVRALADAIRAERGVRFGSLNLVSVDPNDRHDHPDDHHHHGHEHSSPHPG